MNIRKFWGRTLCALVLGLAGCIPHYSPASIKQPVSLEQEESDSSIVGPSRGPRRGEKVPAEPKRLKAWQYPVNIAGGFFTHIFAHEGGHALTALSQGVEIEEFHPYPGYYNGEFHGGWWRYEPGSLEHLSSQEHAFRDMAGPAADILLAETINYNLRNGSVSLSDQSFWATTSLISRIAPIYQLVGAFRGQEYNEDQEYNDFLNFEKNSGVSKETMLGLISAYTLLNSKRIAKEFGVALGRDNYDYNPRNKGVLILIPTHKGLGLAYSLKF